MNYKGEIINMVKFLKARFIANEPYELTKGKIYDVLGNYCSSKHDQYLVFTDLGYEMWVNTDCFEVVDE